MISRSPLRDRLGRLGRRLNVRWFIVCLYLLIFLFALALSLEAVRRANSGGQ